MKWCGEYFNVEIVWIESKIGGRVDKGTHHTIVNFETATRKDDWRVRDNTPYEEMIKMYGIPNTSNKISTRELKNKAITSYMRSIGYAKGTYYTAIGIRVDEFDRMDDKKDERMFVYPLITWKPFTKQHVNFWWGQQPRRLNLKGYQGNCIDCYKKYLMKHYQLAKENPGDYEFAIEMEAKYEYWIHPRRIKYLKKKGKPIPNGPFRFYRDNTSAKEILEISKTFDKIVIDDHVNVNFQSSLDEETESCEVFTDCG